MQSDGGEHTDKLLRATASATRILADKPQLRVTFGSELQLAESSLKLPFNAKSVDQKALVLLRGEADAAALRYRYHSDAIDQRCAPEGEFARKLFDALEQVRVEAIGSRAMPGITANLQASWEFSCNSIRYQQQSTHSKEIPIDAVVLLVREVLTGCPVPELAENFVDPWRSKLQEILSRTSPQLKDNIEDQVVYARLVCRFLFELGFIDEPGNADGQASNEEGTDGDSALCGEGREGSNTLSPETTATESLSDECDSTEEPRLEQGALEANSDPDVSTLNPNRERNEILLTGGDGEESYHIYTSEFDEVVHAREMNSTHNLAMLRGRLDEELVEYQFNVSGLANRLYRLLLASQRRGWDLDLEEGVLDAARLARVVVNPSNALSFKKEREVDFPDTLVTLLIDNSGSMRDRPITVAAMSADILARTLERCGVKVEILGFTTCAWKGGKSQKKWVADGKPANPGRLSDIRHIIYKSAEEPWRRAKQNLGLMLSEGILKENIDGEALVWAYRRQLARPEQRKILIVISDGEPVDDATLTVNNTAYLDSHLRQVIAFIEDQSDIELSAIGIGHDVSQYYTNAVSILDPEQLGGTLMGTVSELFTG